METSASESVATVGGIIGAVESPSVPFGKGGRSNQSILGWANNSLSQTP